MKKILYLWVIVTVLILSACASPTTFEPTQPPASDQVESMASPTQLPPSETSESDCPSAAEGTQILRNTEMGFCLLYLEGYIELFTEPAQICLVPDDPAMACHAANVFINVEPADGRTLSQVADQISAEAPLPEMVERTSLTVDGEPAILIDGLVGVDIHRKVVVMHANRLYTLMFAPWDDTNENWPRIESLHAIVIDSFTFLP